MLLIEIVKFLILVTSCQAMTMKQIKNTGKMMRKSCQPKNNVEDEKIDGIGEGVFIEEKEVKCYIACIMKMANTIKNGKLNLEAGLKQADLLLPEDMKEPAKAAMVACRKVEKIDGIGEGVFIEEKEVKCYIACIMKMANTIKNGKLNLEAGLKQADLLLPEDMKEPAKAAMVACRKVADAHKDICDASFYTTKCIYNHNPSTFFFP